MVETGDSLPAEAPDGSVMMLLNHPVQVHPTVAQRLADTEEQYLWAPTAYDQAWLEIAAAQYPENSKRVVGLYPPPVISQLLAAAKVGSDREPWLTAAIHRWALHADDIAQRQPTRHRPTRAQVGQELRRVADAFRSLAPAVAGLSPPARTALVEIIGEMKKLSQAADSLGADAEGAASHLPKQKPGPRLRSARVSMRKSAVTSLGAVFKVLTGKRATVINPNPESVSAGLRQRGVSGRWHDFAVVALTPLYGDEAKSIERDLKAVAKDMRMNAMAAQIAMTPYERRRKGG